MNELIQVNYDNDRPTVLARDLHEFWRSKPLLKTGSRECVNMDFQKELTIAHF